MKLKSKRKDNHKQLVEYRRGVRLMARLEADLTIKEASRKANICEDYLKRVERNGGASWVLAIRLAHIYGCSANIFL